MDDRSGLEATASAFQRGASMMRAKQQQPKGKTRVVPGTQQGHVATSYPIGRSMKSGGRVRKTAVHLLHEGEYVVPAKGRKRSTKRARIK